MKAGLYVAVFLLALCAPASARDSSLDYSMRDGPRYCEFRVGDKIPPGARLIRRERQYVESPDYYNILHIYRACGGRTSVTLYLEDKKISDIIIKKKGVCIDGRVCIGDTLAEVRKAAPNAKVIQENQEGEVLYLRLGKYPTVGFDVSGLEFDCPEKPDDKCLRHVQGRSARDITLSNRIQP